MPSRAKTGRITSNAMPRRDLEKFRAPESNAGQYHTRPSTAGAEAYDAVFVSPETQAESSGASASAISLLLLATWFGIVTGLLEGAGLLIFQRINWAQWGRVIHVSKQILWISPLVDLLFFLILALVVWSASRLSTRIPSIRVLCFLLSCLSVFG